MGERSLHEKESGWAATRHFNKLFLSFVENLMINAWNGWDAR